MSVFTRALASTSANLKSIAALTSWNLIPLKEKPGVRSIKAGKVLITENAINYIVKYNIQESPGLLQTVTGLKVRVEAVIYSMSFIFEDSSTDANNAFNKFNRKVALHSIQVTCPS